MHLGKKRGNSPLTVSMQAELLYGIVLDAETVCGLEMRREFQTCISSPSKRSHQRHEREAKTIAGRK